MNLSIFDTVILLPALAVSILVAFKTYNSSRLLTESEFEINKLLKDKCTRSYELMELVSALDKNTIKEDELLRLEIVALRTLELLDKEKKELLLNGVTQSNLNSRKLYLKKIYKLDLEFSFDHELVLA
jgi:hypothetical protein